MNITIAVIHVLNAAKGAKKENMFLLNNTIKSIFSNLYVIKKN